MEGSGTALTATRGPASKPPSLKAAISSDESKSPSPFQSSVAQVEFCSTPSSYPPALKYLISVQITRQRAARQAEAEIV